MTTLEEIKEDLHFIDFLSTHGLRNSTIKEYTLRMKTYLRDSNKAENSIYSMLTTVFSFYREFDIETPKIRVKALHPIN